MNKKIILCLILVTLTSALCVIALNSEQTQYYWKCLDKDECLNFLKNKQYTAYRTCALNCSAKAAQYIPVQMWCKDSDGGADYLTKGVVTTDLNQIGVEDYCYTFNKNTPQEKTYLMEGSCFNNKYSYIQKNCGGLGANYLCLSGACIEPPTVTASIMGITWNSAIIKVVTDEDIVCRYDSVDISFEDMKGIFEVTGKQEHYAFLHELESSTDYDYTIKCKEGVENIGTAAVNFKTLEAPAGNYIRVETDKDVYELGENVKITVYLVNIQDVDVEYILGSSSCTYSFSIYSSFEEKVCSSDCKKCTGDIVTVNVPANSKLLLDGYVWNQHKSVYQACFSNEQVKPDIYQLNVIPSTNNPLAEGEKFIAIVKNK